MDKQVISYDQKGFIINGKREFLIGGEFHYFRVPASQWEDRLSKMRSTGANLISVYIAWSMHEPEEGIERWTGDYDLDRFLSLCQKYGFYVLIKPGPYICAELDFGGHPDWLIKKIARKEFRLRMLDEGYIRLCRKWYKTVSEKINGHLITNGGSIIAAQIENEYDHLIEYGEETITVQDAINYLMTLKSAMEEVGIDVPKFANEAAFLRGKGVIDTRTYYPNIPGLWMWEFDLFEGKIIDSKKSQSNSPVMILELQAGWFSQIGAPTYAPDMNVVSGVSKSVLIQGASIINYYMMVGGTTFPFIGARGDVFFLGGLGNITSYDFGGAPVGENGGLHNEKYYWVKGFIRFAKEFSNLILNSDGKSYVSIVSGGENIALLARDGAVLDYALDKSDENFNVYEEGNENGRFFFVRNLEADPKDLTIKVSKDLSGKEINFKAYVLGRETRMLPIAFKVPGTDVAINYSTSEVLLSKQYGSGTAFVLYGKKGTGGELNLNVKAEEIKVIKGDVKVYANGGDALLQYSHSDLSIIKVRGATIFIVEEGMIGGIEELTTGLMFNDLYYLPHVRETADGLELGGQIKEFSRNTVRFYPMDGKAGFSSARLGNERYALTTDPATSICSTTIETGKFGDTPEFKWVSEWKYAADSDEIDAGCDMKNWVRLEKPISLEEAGFIEHGYYWYKTGFNLEQVPGMIFMDYAHNDTDRMFIYINGILVYKSHNKKIAMKDVTSALKPGMNDLTILYANEFHNKSHPHEGAIVKYSGIMNPFILHGTYSDGKACRLELGSFFVKKGLTGMNEGYHTLDFNDSGWLEAPNVEKFVTAKEMGHIVWFRRKFRYDVDEGFHATIRFRTREADQRLTVYVNGRAVARYDILGPQQEFHIPEAFLNRGEDNVLSIILECPAFYDELQGGYRRGYMYQPEIEQAFVAKKVTLTIE